MNNIIEKQDFEQLAKCKNCNYFKSGRCYATNKNTQVTEDTHCINGFFDKINEKQQLKEKYEEILYMIDYYMDIPKEKQNIIALWIIGTYLHSDFPTYPYLFINAMRGSGKTRLLKLICALSKDGQLLNSLTDAVLFRTTGTLGIDEFEGLNSKDKGSLRELLNSGYKKGTKVFRMAKKKTIDGEKQVVESFEPYRPIAIANIWGMEEVLGDRCIILTLDKSSNSSKTKLVEDFENSEKITTLKNAFIASLCSLCSVVTPRNIYSKWNDFIKITTQTTYTTHTTLTTLTTQNYTKDEIERLNNGEDLVYFDLNSFFNKINDSGVDGRYLELFFPLYYIAKQIDDEILEQTIEFSKSLVNQKKEDEKAESKDVLLFKYVAEKCDSSVHSSIKILANRFKEFLDEDDEWINAKWFGRALKRLNLIIDKTRTGGGIIVKLNVEKAKKQLQQFESI